MTGWFIGQLISMAHIHTKMIYGTDVGTSILVLNVHNNYVHAPLCHT